VGKDIYEMFIKGYTAKQWGRPCKQLPASIIKRIPLRFTFDDCYWNATWAGIPTKGYTALVEKMLEGIDTELNVDYDPYAVPFYKTAKKMVYTGPIDRFFNYKYGALEYRSLKFKTIENEEDFQGVLQVNYTEEDTPFTRIVEHKHFYDNPEQHKKSIVTFEYPDVWNKDKEPYYPINDAKNTAILEKYQEELLQQCGPMTIVTGRLGSYKYIDMDQTVTMAMELAKKECL
jgi:UDP-galactopyranose mutase